MNTLISTAYIKHSHVLLLELWQNNFNDPEAYLEPGETSKLESFAKNSQQSKTVNHFCIKHSILDVWQGYEYAPIICYSLSGKTEDANKIDSVVM